MDYVDVRSSEAAYGFIIDNRKCIGCHACSTACKAENEVPLGVNRTWVKYVESGRYPDVRRHFQVTRCNHCANPPCVRICPTKAMYQRADGIVEFDNRLCIGCKGCLQACPYDAIYIDPENGTAAKCHYCAHRTDLGLEPACVVVCPEHAIIAGDVNDPRSEISQLLAQQPVTVRKPEQGTLPKLYYINGSDAALTPTERAPQTFLWADVVDSHGTNGATATPVSQGGPIHIRGRAAEQMVQVAYNAQHEVPWHWPVPAYLVTKSIASGLFLILALLWGLNLVPFDRGLAWLGGFVTLLFIGLTTLLLVIDLERPERFLYILRRPQWRSWLTRGAVVLITFSLLVSLWWGVEILGAVSALSGVVDVLRPILLALGFPLAVLSAIYTAFLFAQAEGRDLWQSPLLPFHLLVQAVVAGSGALLLLDLVLVLPAALSMALLLFFVVGLLVDLFVTVVGEFGIPHASDVAARAAHDISHGKYRLHFWLGSVALGHVLPLLLALMALLLATLAPWLAAAAAVAALTGLYFFEYAFVMAPQDVPNS